MAVRVAFAMAMLMVAAAPAQDAAISNNADAAQLVKDIAAKPAIFLQSCVNVRDEPPWGEAADGMSFSPFDVTISFAGYSSYAEHQVSAKQYSDLRRVRDGAIKALTAWLQEGGAANEGEETAWMKPGRTKLNMLVDLNATAALPQLKAVAEKLQKEPACWQKPFGDERFAAARHPDHPVTQISGADATAYCAWTGGRLPTVVEWEVAARAGVSTRYPWGSELMPGGRPMANIWHGESHLKEDSLDGFMYLAPVARFPHNHWGLYDVIGNVFEYCDGGVVSLAPHAAEHLVAARGGSWWCSAGTCASYNLIDIGQMDRRGSLANQGFRLARTLR